MDNGPRRNIPKRIRDFLIACCCCLKPTGVDYDGFSGDNHQSVHSIDQQTHKYEQNYLFYTNQIRSKPDGDTIENILKYWYGNPERLETDHGYIQWLFPTMDQGTNKEARKLMMAERDKILSDPTAIERLTRAFKLMLDFYGMVLKGGSCVERADHWQKSYKNLIEHTHNNLRITRILKCLTIFGKDHYCQIWLTFLVNEIYVTKELKTCKDSLERFWISACSNDVQGIISKHIRECSATGDCIVDIDMN